MRSDSLNVTLAALADPTRRAILARLARGEASVNDLAAQFLPGMVNLPFSGDISMRLLSLVDSLLGAALGDDSVPGIGQRPLSQVRPEERTTPAGRFAGEAGRNLVPEDVVWVDYENAVSMHRVRATQPAERRLERLATPTPQDNRISYGCINVPVSFFEGVIWPRFRASGGMVYVLPDRKPLAEVFPMLAAAPPADGAPLRQ